MGRLILIAAVSMSLAGCLFIPARAMGSSRSGASKPSAKCKPSQFWDGDQCRHKGKGSGARKHDD